MDILKINGQIIEIDDDTAIGLNSQSYDIKNPANKLVDYTDSFSVPAVPATCNVFGYADSLSSLDVEIYDEFRADYVSQGLEIIRDGKIYLDEIQYNDEKINRFNLISVSKNSIWDDLKDISYAQFVDEFLAWASLPPVGSFSSIISLLASPDYDIRLVNYIGILGDELDEAGTAYIESDSTYYIGYNQAGVIYSGGHFAVSCKTIFRFIEHKFGINFNTGATFQYNLFSDPYASALMIPVREISLDPVRVSIDELITTGFENDTYNADPLLISVSGTITTVKLDVTEDLQTGQFLYFEVWRSNTMLMQTIFTTVSYIAQSNFAVFSGETLEMRSYLSGLNEKTFDIHFLYADQGIYELGKNSKISTKEDVANFEDLTLYDIVSSYMTIFNVLKVESLTDIKLYRFDDIENLTAEEFPGKFVSRSKKSTSIENISQKNEIKYSSVFETGNSLTAGFIATSLNKSLPKTGEYLTIKGYVPAYRSGTIILSYGTDGGSLKEPCFFIPTTNKQTKTIKHYSEGVYLSTSVDLNDCAVYSLNGEFTLLKKIINKPCMWTGKFLITPYQFSKIKFFAKYRIPQFGCDCILISIAGYNPRKSTEPNECTFIKITN